MLDESARTLYSSGGGATWSRVDEGKKALGAILVDGFLVSGPFKAPIKGCVRPCIRMGGSGSAQAPGGGWPDHAFDMHPRAIEKGSYFLMLILRVPNVVYLLLYRVQLSE